MAITTIDYTTDDWRSGHHTKFDGDIITSCSKCGRRGAMLITRNAPSIPYTIVVTHEVTVRTGDDAPMPGGVARIITDHCVYPAPDNFGSSARQ